MNTKCLKLTVAGALAAAASGTAAYAQSSDAIIDKLVDKGILTVDEATELKDEADKGFTSAYSVKSGMSDWVSALKINGDFRGRYEGFYSGAAPYSPSNPTSPGWVDRNRWRYRLRLSLVANLHDNFEVGLRLGSGDLSGTSSTGGADPISLNQTLTGNASRKGIFIDLAYGRWYALNSPDLSGVLTFGKMENPFVFSDMVFDPDYTPEGAGENLTYNLRDNQTLRFNAGQFVLGEISTQGDPYLLGLQTRLDSKWTPKVASSLGASFLTIQGKEQLTSSAVPDINKGNDRFVTGSGALGAPVHGFDSIVGDAAVTYTLDSFPMYPTAFPIKVFGDVIHNFAAPDMNNGYEAGIAFGKAGKKKTWEISYRYKVLEGNAWWEELVDSDFGAYYSTAVLSPYPPFARSDKAGYQAGTNVRGHVVKLAYSLTDFLQFSATWFGTELIEEQPANSYSKMNRLQLDALLKF